MFRYNYFIVLQWNEMSQPELISGNLWVVPATTNINAPQPKKMVSRRSKTRTSLRAPWIDLLVFGRGRGFSARQTFRQALALVNKIAKSERNRSPRRACPAEERPRSAPTGIERKGAAFPHSRSSRQIPSVGPAAAARWSSICFDPATRSTPCSRLLICLAAFSGTLRSTKDLRPSRQLARSLACRSC
jgi:hypothetical protein